MGRISVIFSHANVAERGKKLIRQVVEAADYGEPPPPELELAWQCERWRAMPDAGGLLDQDNGLMRKMTIYSNIFNTVVKLRSMTGHTIHALTDSERRLIKYLLDEGALNG